MNKKSKTADHVNQQLVIGALLGAAVVAVMMVVFNTSLGGGLYETAPQVFGRKGGGSAGGGVTEGDYDSSVFNFPENASSELLNTSFEINNDSNKLVPDNWTYHYDQPNRNTGVDCTVAHTGNCSYYVSGRKNSAIKQYVKVSGNAGDVVTVSGWGRGLNVGDTAGQNTGVYWVQAWIHYTDGTTQFDVLKKFPNGTYDFIQAEASFVAIKPFFGITVFNRFDGTGEAWFDDIGLSIRSI